MLNVPFVSGFTLWLKMNFQMNFVGLYSKHRKKLGRYFKLDSGFGFSLLCIDSDKVMESWEFPSTSGHETRYHNIDLFIPIPSVPVISLGSRNGPFHNEAGGRQD